MASFKPFHVSYEGIAGMAQVFGAEIPNLDAQLDIYGGGLDTESDFRGGGPLVTSLPGINGIVLCWIRGVVHKRKNVWEAWGVVAPSFDSIRYWPSHWAAMKSEPTADSITNFATKLAQGWGTSWPDQTKSLPHFLSKIHREHLADSTITKFTVPMCRHEDIGILAWLWLFGPVSWESARVGPPRKMLAAVSTPLTYEGLIGEAAWPESKTSISPFIQQLLSMVRDNNTEAAAQNIADFRQQEPDVRRRRLEGTGAPSTTRGVVRVPTAPPVHEERAKKSWLTLIKPKPIKPRSEENKTTDKTTGEILEKEKSATLTPQEISLGRLNLKLNTLLLAILALSTVYAFDYLGRTIGDFSGRKDSDLAANEDAHKVAANETSGLKDVVVEKEKTVAFSLETLNLMHRSLLHRLNLEASTGLKASNPLEIKEAALRSLLADAAVQIFLSELGCAPADVKIDGDRGDLTNRRVKACNNKELEEIYQDDDRALEWLHSWLLLHGES